MGVHNTPPDSDSDSHSSNNKKKRDQPIDGEFTQFWKVYPRKVGKRSALRVWMKLGKDRPPLKKILAAIDLQKQSESWQRDGGQYIPHPTTWLNQGRWEDEPTTVEGGRPKHDPAIAAEMNNFGWGQK
jgi:hypothetical protein